MSLRSELGPLSVAFPDADVHRELDLLLKPLEDEFADVLHGRVFEEIVPVLVVVLGEDGPQGPLQFGEVEEHAAFVIPLDENVDLVGMSMERAAAVVRRLLGFARPAELHLAPCQLNDVVTEALAMLRHKADLQKIAVDLALDAHLPTLIGDYWQLQEVCVNLLLNAVQAMPEGGRLRISSRLLPDHRLELQITDTGCGIPATHLPRIFDPFFTTKPPGEGTGLGLSVVHALIERHCGSIDVQSQAGRGTTFVIRFPLDLSSASQTCETPSATIVDLARSMASPNILVVDDDQAVCQMLAQFLVDSGYQATTAHSGNEALSLAMVEKPEMVLLDVRMPGMDGVECLRRLKGWKGDLPVIMVTAADDETVAGHCLQLGAAEYLVKPLSLEHLRRTIADHLSPPQRFSKVR